MAMTVRPASTRLSTYARMSAVSSTRSVVGGRASFMEGSRGRWISYPADRRELVNLRYVLGTCQPPCMMTMVGLVAAIVAVSDVNVNCDNIYDSA